MDIAKAEEIFEAMIKMESAMALYYRECCTTFIDHYDFFNEIEKQELQHEHDLIYIIEQIKQTPEHFTWNLYLDKGIINEQSKAMFKKAQEIKIGSITIENALKFALTRENTIMEKQYADIVISEDTLIMDMLKKIASETEVHYNQINNKLEEIQE